jgi:hypothetical protein
MKQVQDDIVLNCVCSQSFPLPQPLSSSSNQNQEAKSETPGISSQQRVVLKYSGISLVLFIENNESNLK